MKRPMMMLMLMMIGLPCFGQPDLSARLKTQMEYLTSPDLAGRDAPGPNGDKVANWVADRFKEDGLIPALPHDSFFQGLPLSAGRLDTAQTTFVIETDKKRYEYSWGDGFYFFPRRIAYVEREFDPVFCGLGMEIAKAGRNDYSSEVKGKAAIVLAGGDTTFMPMSGGMSAHPAFKAAAAERAGATMLIILYVDNWSGSVGSEQRKKIADAHKRLVDLDEPSSEFPVVYLDASPLMSDIFADTVTSKSTSHNDQRMTLMEWLNRHSGFFSKVKFASRFKDPETLTSRNVVALFSGSTDEWVIVGAHYDHIGEGFPGADDNASGTVGLLELARKWGRSGELPKRGIIFVSFTCEEDGLLGSQWFAQHLPVPQEKVVAMINLDMIGRQGGSNPSYAVPPGGAVKDFAAAYFSAPSPALKDILRSSSDGVDLQTTVQPINSFRHFGDGAPFHEAGIPTVHIFSGFHADYHQPTDTPDKIDYSKLAKMIDLTDRTLRGLVEAPARPGFDPTIKAEGGGMGY